MIRVKAACIVFLTSFFAAGCGTSFSTDNSETVSVLEVRIQHGLEDHWIFVETSSGGYMQTFVDGSSSQSGARIVRYVEINSSQSIVVIRQVPTNGNRNSQVCYIPLQLNMDHDYILDLSADDNQIHTSLLEKPQQYL